MERGVLSGRNEFDDWEKVKYKVYLKNTDRRVFGKQEFSEFIRAG